MKMYLFDKAQKVRRWLTDKDFIEARLTEQINAACELKFSMPVKNALDGSLFYVAVPHPSGNGYVLCKIISESKQDDRVEYEAIEAAYDELQAYNYIKDVRPHDRNAGEMLSIALQGTRWTSGVVYGGATGSTNFYYISTLEAIKKIVELFGLEVTFTVTIDPQTNQITRRQVNLYSQQGQRTGKRFEYGSNLLSVTREEARDGLITALIGRGKGEQVSEGQDGSPDGYGRRIDFADIVWSKAKGNPADKPYGQEYVEDKDATAAFGFDNGKPRIGLQIFEDITDKNELLKATWAALQTLKRPQVSFKASVGDVGSLGLGDTVAIIRHDIGIEYFTRVYKVDHNLLDEKQNEIELGDDFDGDSITRTVSNVAGSVSQVKQVASYAATAANGKNTVNYGSPQPQVAAEGDIWYKDLGNGETDMMQYRNGNWVLITSTRDLRNVEKKVNDTKAALDKEIALAFAAVEDEAKKRKEIDDQVNQALANAKDDFDKSWNLATQANAKADSNAAHFSNIDAGGIKTGTLNANLIKTGSMSADRIVGGSLDFNNITAKNLSASEIVSGTLDTTKVTISGSLSANLIKTGTMSADRIYGGKISANLIAGGTLDFSKAEISNLSADDITSGTLNGGNVNVINLNADNITSGKLSGVNGYFDLKNGDLYSSYENHSLKISNGEVFFKAPSTKPVSKGKIVNIGSITSYKKNSNFQGNSLTIRGNDGLILSTFSAELGLGATTGSLTFGDYTNGQYDYPFSGSIIQAGYDGIIINGGFYTGLEQYGSEESYEKYNKHSLPMRAALVAGFPPDDYYRMENFYGSYYSGWRQPGIYIDGAPENNKNFSMIHIRAGNYIELETTGESGVFLDKDGVSVNNKLTANGNVTVLKDFITLGSKNAAVETSQGTTLINAYETAEYYFGDIGESATDESGICKVMIDPLFLEIVNTSIPYQVFVSPYSDDKVWVAERYDTFFVVKSDKPNAKFTWELKAKRLGYENNRLEVVNIKKPEAPNE